MYEVTVKADFAAAHRLVGYQGKCENLHGHNWDVELTVSGDKLDDMGMLVDFRILKKELRVLLEKLDHAYLNDLPYFKDINPTTENVARFIYKEMSKVCSEGKLKKVTVWESRNAAAMYFE